MSDRRALLARAAPALLLLLVAGGVLAGAGGEGRLANADPTASNEMTTALDSLPADPAVLVAFDADLGTYAEIRPTVRTLLADLLGRGAQLALVSLTPEGRALAIAELERLDRLGVDPRQITDLGFLPGAEAALVSIARDLSDEPAEAMAARLSGIERGSAIGMIAVVGGNDLGPRSWVEQVLPRTTDVQILAVAPTVLLPELLPYRLSGQLSALIGTPRDGATYRGSVDLGRLDRVRDPIELSSLAILAGMLAAVVALGQGLAARLLHDLRATRSRDVS